MKVIGITGGVGCGKSTVLKLLQDNFNSYIIMADDVAKKLMEPGNIAYNQVLSFFSEDILNVDGTIDRPKLASIIFKNDKKRMVLNSIVHPLVKKEIVAMITNLRIQGKYDYVFVEAALLIEDHYEVFLDEMWYIYASADVRRQRLITSRGYSVEKIDDMMASQKSDAEFRSACSTVIDNSKDLEFTLAQLVKLL